VGDPREVPPSAGTIPLVSKEQIRRYREDATIYAEHREKGTHPYTLGEIDARITACAADLAAAKGEGPVSPPILRELVSLFWHRLFRDPPLDAERRAGFEADLSKTNTDANVAREKATRAERRRRDLEAEAKLAGAPLTGTIFTQPWTILFCLIPGAVIEVLGSAPSLEIAFDISTLWSTVFAVAISAILILAADQLGNALGGAAEGSRRRTALFAGLLVAVAVIAGAWAIRDLADSRTNNLAREQQLEAIESAGGDTSGGFGGFDELSGPRNNAEEEAKREAEAEEVTAEAARRQAAIEELPGPNFTFFIPLSFLILSTATLVAFRIEAAREWNERTQGIEDARMAAAESRKREADARQAANEAALPDDQIFQEASAYVEREHGVMTGWMERFRAEYQRYCAVEKTDPRSIVVPRLPAPEEALTRLLFPRGGPPAGSSNGFGGAEDGPTRGEAPPQDKPSGGPGAGAAGGGPAPAGGATAAGEQQAAGDGAGRRREPPPRTSRRPRRRSEDKRPTGWGSTGRSDR